MQISKKLYDKLYRLAYHDQLTGCYSRNWLAENYNEKDEFMFIIIDINGLKAINDKKGHIAGDNLIISVAQKLMPYGDLIRFGGDEFILLVPVDFNVEILKDKRYCFGWQVKDTKSKLDDVFRRADKLLYQMKMNKKDIK